MKKRLYIAALAIAAIATLPSCEDFLNPESKTDITDKYSRWSEPRRDRIIQYGETDSQWRWR